MSSARLRRPGAVFPDSDLAGRWRGRWNHVKVEEHEITGDRRECLGISCCTGSTGTRTT